MNDKPLDSIPAPASESIAPPSTGTPDPFERVRLDPTDFDAWDVVDDIAREEDSPDDAERLYDEALQRNDLSLETRREVGQRFVVFLEEWYEETSRPVAVLKQLLAADHTNGWALEKLSLLLTLSERWDELLGIYDSTLERSDSKEQRIALLEEAARIAKDFAGQAQRASDYLKQLFFLKPHDVQLATALERRLEQQERHRDLVDVWTAQLAGADAAEQRALRASIAQQHLDFLKDANEALTVTRQLLEDPEGEEAACNILEQVSQAEHANAEAKRQALATLRDSYARRARAADVVRVLQRSLEVAPDDTARIELNRLLVEWHMRNEELSPAQHAAAAWLRLSPKDSAALAKLEELAEQTREYRHLADALVEAAEAETDHEFRMDLLLRAARTLRELADIPLSATELFARVLLDADSSASQKLTAARQLTELLTTPAQLDQRLDVLEHLSRLEPTAEAQRAVLGEAARLAETLGDDDRALRLWERCLSQDPSDQEALDARVGVLARGQRHEELLPALRARYDHSDDAQTRREDLVWCARIYAEELQRPDRAIEVWRELEQVFERNAETVDALSDLLQRGERFDELVTLLSEVQEQETDFARRTRQLSLLGDVYRRHQQDAERAVQCYAQALELDPLHELARDGVRALIDVDRVRKSACETLVQAFRDAEEWDAVLGLLETRLAADPTPQNQQTVLLEASEVAERRQNAPTAALGYVVRAFGLLAESSVEQTMLRLAEATDGWEISVEGYQSALTACSDAKRKSELLLQQGHVLEERLEHWEEALAAYRSVIELDRSNLDAACSIVRCAAQTGTWQDAAWALLESARAYDTVLEELAVSFERAAASDWPAALAALNLAVMESADLPTRTSHDVKFQLARWYRDHTDNLEAAIATLSEAVDEHRSAPSLGMLVELQRRQPSAALVESLLKLADVVAEPLGHLHEAARVALEVVGDARMARPILERTLALAEQLLDEEPEAPAPRAIAAWSIEQLVAIAREGLDHAQAYDLLTRGAKLPLEDALVLDFLHRAAEIAATDLGKAARAIELCQRVLQRDVERQDTIELLARLYEEEGQLEPLISLRSTELETTRNPEARLALRLEIARVLGMLGGNEPLRLKTLRDNLGEAAGHPETIEAIANILTPDERFETLYELLIEQAEALNEHGHSQQSAQLYARAGLLAEQAFGDVDAALEAYRAAVGLSPSVDVLDALAAIHTSRREHAEAVAWLKQRLDLTPNHELEARRQTRVRLGRGLRDAECTDDAIEYLEAGLAEDPAGGSVRELLAELREARREWAHYAQLLREGVPFAPDRATRVRFLTRSAEVLWDELADVEAAIPLLQQAHHLEPEDQELRLLLARAMREAGQLPPARELLEGLLDEFGRRRTAQRASVHFQLALLERTEGRLDAALEQLDAAAKIQRTDPLILKTLGDVAAQKGELERAERAYRALLLLIGRETANESPIGESSILFELYRIAVQRDDQARAKDLLDSALQAAESNSQEARRLEQALREAGSWELLLDALERRGQSAQDPNEQREVLRTRADVLVQLQRADEAIDLLLQLLEATPDDRELLEQARELALQTQRSERLRDALLKLAQHHDDTDPQLACGLWMQLGAMAGAEQDWSAAAGYYERAQATGVQPEETFQELKHVLEQVGDMAGLMLALERYVVSDPTQVVAEHLTEALYRSAELNLCVQSGVDRGCERLRQALEREPDYARAGEILQTALELVRPTPELLSVLEEVARRLGDDQYLLWALMRINANETTSLERLREAVALARALGESEHLLEALQRTVHFAQEQDQLEQVVWALVELAEQHRERQQYEPAQRLLEQAIGATEPSETFELRLRLAELLHSDLCDYTAAALIYEQLADEAPADARVWRPLLDVYRKSEQLERLEACLSRAEEHVTNDDERQALQLERVRLQIDAGRLEEAESSLREALARTPANQRASELLLDLLEQQQRHDEARDLMYKLLDAAIERADRARIISHALRLGALLERDDVEAAISVYRTAQHAARGDAQVLSALLQLLPEDEVQERADVLESLLPTQSDEAETRALQLANLRDSLGDTAGIERAYELGFKVNPHSGTLRRKLENWYREREHWAPLAELLTVDADHHEDLDGALQIYAEAATILDQQLGDAAAAADVMERARQRAPLASLVLESLCEYLVTAARPDRAIEILDESLEATSDQQQTAFLYHLRGIVRSRIGGEDLPTLARAVADLNRALELGSTSSEPDLLTLLQRQQQLANQLGDDDLERQAVMRLAELLPKGSESAPALALLREWSERHPADRETVSLWAQLALAHEDWDGAAAAYRLLFEHTEGDARVGAVLGFADACEKAGQLGEARSLLEQVHHENPGLEPVRSRLRQMYEAAQAYEALAELMLQDAERTESPEERFEALLEAGMLLLRTQQPQEHAVSAFEEALRLQPEEHRATVGLAHAHTMLGNIEEACGILEQAIKSHGKRRSPELSELQHAMSMVAFAAGDDEGRFAWLDAALQSDRRNGVVAAELATFAMDRGDYDAAIKALQLVTLLKDNCPMPRAEAYLRQAIISQQRGDLKKAMLLAKRALTADANYEPARAFLEQLG